MIHYMINYFATTARYIYIDCGGNTYECDGQAHQRDEI